MGFNSKGCSGQATDMKVCLLFVCCTIVGSHAKGYYGNQGGYRGMTLNVEDGDGKTLNFKTSSSSSEENTRNSREAGTQTSQDSGEGHWCRPHCYWNGHRCVCHHEDSEEPTKPTEPVEGSDEGSMCQYCIHAHCFPAVCKLNHCCFHHQEAEPSNKTSTSQESAEGHPCPPHCHHTHDHRCVCHHKDSEEQTIPTEEKSSVQKLVSAGLDLLKAGKKLKFNVDVKNPEALLSKDDTSKPKQRFRAYWPKTA